MKRRLSDNRTTKQPDAVAAFRRRPVSLASRSACLLFLGLSVLLSLGCARERSITPTPTKYHATLITTDTYSYQEYVVRTLDLSSGTVKGEIRIDVGGGIPAGLAVTPDGRYGATFHGIGKIQVFDLQSLHVTHELSLTPPGLSSLHILPFDSLKLLVSCYTGCTSVVYDLPTGTVETLLPGSRFGFSSPDQSELVTMSTGGMTRRSCETWDIVDSFSFESPLGGRLWVHGAEVSPAYDRVYILGGDASGQALFRYNLADHSCTFRQPILPGRFAVSPDGSEVWVLQSGGRIRESPFGIERWEYILILDGSTGVPLDTIRTARLLEQYTEYSAEMVGLRAIAFHPDEPVVYIVTQSALSMLVMNRTTRAVVGSLDVGIVSEIVISPTRNASGHFYQ